MAAPVARVHEQSTTTTPWRGARSARVERCSLEVADREATFMMVCGRNITVEGRLIRVGRLDGEKYKFLDDPGPVLDGLRRAGTRVDLFTFMQRVTETSPKHDYPMEWDNLAALPLSTFDHWWTKQIGFKARNKAKQARNKGVTVREVPLDDALVRGIWEIYNECPVRQGKPFLHYGKDIESVRRSAATFLDSSVFIGAFLGDRLIGFIKMTMDDTGTQAGLMHIVTMIQHRDRAPTNALIVQAVRSCAERRIAHLVYSNFTYGNKQRDSLSAFKERNGFQRIDVPRYYVPLTFAGRLVLHSGLHRPLRERIPEPMLVQVREVRARWYNRRFTVDAAAVTSPPAKASSNSDGR
jgi:hypothetical protein